MVSLHNGHRLRAFDRNSPRCDSQHVGCRLELIGNEPFAGVMHNGVRRSDIDVDLTQADCLPYIRGGYGRQPSRRLVFGCLVHNVKNRVAVDIKDVNVYDVVKLLLITVGKFETTWRLGIPLAGVALPKDGVKGFTQIRLLHVGPTEQKMKLFGTRMAETTV